MATNKIPVQLSASQVAARLGAAGITVVSSQEGDEVEDGMVVVTDKIHIQVPYFAGGLGVVREDDDGFLFYPERRAWDKLIADIRESLGMVAA